MSTLTRLQSHFLKLFSVNQSAHRSPRRRVLGSALSFLVLATSGWKKSSSQPRPPPPRFVLVLLQRGLEQAGGGLAVRAHLPPPGGAEPSSVAALLMMSMARNAHISAGNGLAGRPHSRRQRLTCDLRVHAEPHHHRMSRETKPGAGDPEVRGRGGGSKGTPDMFLQLTSEWINN